MSKELTALEKVEIIKSRCTTLSINHKIGSRDIANKEVQDCVRAIEKCLEPIEKALKRLEQYETPAKKKDIMSVAKRLTALEIIKEKRVNVDTLLLCINTPVFDIKTGKVLPEIQLEMYNNSVINNTSFVKDYNRTLTQAEFGLLKEELL